ncbi:MAG TPA: cell wall-active antibiotics response protein LiaF [Actinomycetota bacterium]|nr:cell wall-active antibiotics response protein LiaF [Actinomycetota bacterium]
MTTKATATRPAASRPRTGQVIGVMLLLGGVAWLLEQTGTLSVTTSQVLAAELVVLGLGLIAVSNTRHHGGLIALGLVLILLLANLSSFERRTTEQHLGDLHLNTVVGDLDIAPRSVRSIGAGYRVGVGDLRLDLTHLEIPEGTTEVLVMVGVGDIRVVVPGGSDVSVSASAVVGEVTIFGRKQSFGRVEKTTPGFSDAPKRIKLEIGVVLGDVRVQHADL